MKTTIFIKEIPLRLTNEAVEIHRCPSCDGVFGIDASFLDQIGIVIFCPMCTTEIKVTDPK